MCLVFNLYCIVKNQLHLKSDNILGIRIFILNIKIH